jgi:hypothetical protein
MDKGGGGDDESYLNPPFFLLDAPTVDIIITTRHAGVAVGEMQTTEAAELFRKSTKFTEVCI